MQKIDVVHTEFANFQRLSDSEWRVHTRLNAPPQSLSVEISMTFTRKDKQSVYDYERTALRLAHAALTEQLRDFDNQYGPLP